MTRYTVIWEDDALGELTELWMAASDRTSVTTASHVLDRLLSEDVINKGNSLHEGLRWIMAMPLTAIFSIDEKDRIVRVVKVRLSE